jgi:tetratricopeptide (TPR) repeat protein
MEDSGIRGDESEAVHGSGQRSREGGRPPEKAKQDDPNTESALGQAYVLAEKYQEALPLLTAAINREPNKPDALMIYYRGISEYKTGKIADAEKSFNQVIKLNPKDSLSLFYLAQIALGKNDLDGAIANLNRVTVNDARMVGAWTAADFCLPASRGIESRSG